MSSFTSAVPGRAADPRSLHAALLDDTVEIGERAEFDDDLALLPPPGDAHLRLEVVREPVLQLLEPGCLDSILGGRPRFASTRLVEFRRLLEPASRHEL